MDNVTFLIRPEPFYDESLYGYVKRIMNLNCYHIKWVNKLIGQDYKSLRFYHPTYDGGSLEKLSFLLKKSVKDLEVLTLAKEHVGTGNLRKVMSSALNFRVCTACLTHHGLGTVRTSCKGNYHWGY